MEKKFKQQSKNCLRIVLFGPESTGKTTLAKQLASHYKTNWVPEYMREYLQKKWDDTKEVCTKQDLVPIAKGQLALEFKKEAIANHLLFLDTNLLELKVYSEYYYKGYCPSFIKQQLEELQYDFYFLTGIDVPWEKDDLRDRPNDRSTLFSTFETELKKQKTPYKLLLGNKKQRFYEAKGVINKLLESQC